MSKRSEEELQPSNVRIFEAWMELQALRMLLPDVMGDLACG